METWYRWRYWGGCDRVERGMHHHIMGFLHAAQQMSCFVKMENHGSCIDEWMEKLNKVSNAMRKKWKARP